MTISSYAFSPAERFAVYFTHGEKCYLCTTPVDLKSMEVDHVIPEHLLTKPEGLKQVLNKLGLPATFEVNSYENWMPACRTCNGKKKGMVFEPSLLVQVVLQQAAAKAEQASNLAKKTISKQKTAKALVTLEIAHANGELDEETKAGLLPLLTAQETYRAPELVGKPLRLTPLYTVLSEGAGIRLIKGPYGVGVRLSESSGASWDCPSCGSIGAWNGARCVICGQMDDD